jgi:hypothetical protein
MAADVSTAAGRGESLSRTGIAMQTGIVASLQGLHAIATEVVTLGRHTVSTTVQATGSTARLSHPKRCRVLTDRPAGSGTAPGAQRVADALGGNDGPAYLL